MKAYRGRRTISSPAEHGGQRVTGEVRCGGGGHQHFTLGSQLSHTETSTFPFSLLY